MFKKTNTPHDSIVKQHLLTIDGAIAFIKQYVEPEILSLLDLSSIEIINTEFIDRSIRRLHSDILYKIKFKDTKEYIYILIEHQSTLYRYMNIKVLAYQLAITKRHINNNKHEKYLPYIITFVYYNGEVETDLFERDISELYKDPKIYKKYEFGRYIFININKKTINEVFDQGENLILLDMLLKKDVDLDDISKAFLIAQNKGMFDELIFHSVIYLLGKVEQGKKVQVEEKIVNKLNMKEDIMNYIQSLKKEGRELGKIEGMELGKIEGMELGKIEGMELGKIEGMELGKMEASYDVAEKLIKMGYSDEMIKTLTGLDENKISDLKNKYI